MAITRTLAGCSVLITGANRGLGRALLEDVLHRGAGTVYAASRVPLDHPDDRVVPISVDLTDPDSIQTAAEAVPTLDILINNAGLGAIGDDLGDEQLVREHLQVNVLGPLSLTNALLPALSKSRGRLVMVSSIAAVASLPVMPSYSLSKAAALSLTQSQRSLLGRRGIRVHLVLAGPIDTDMTRELPIAKAAASDVATAIIDGVLRGDEDIFPDMMSAALATGWDSGPIKTLERANAAMLPPPDHVTGFSTTKIPSLVYAAITDPRAWWGGEITGVTDEVGAEFTYRHGVDHVSVQRVTALVPDRRVEWEVLSSDFGFVDEPAAHLS